MQMFSKQLERTIATHCISSITLFINTKDLCYQLAADTEFQVQVFQVDLSLCFYNG